MPMTPSLTQLIAQGESETLELKRSTAELKRCGETRCAFLNGEGGKVLIGVARDGKLVGQDVADITLREIAAMLGRVEPRSSSMPPLATLQLVVTPSEAVGG
jgi:ATP-dependent DNA helicase RecG